MARSCRSGTTRTPRTTTGKKTTAGCRTAPAGPAGGASADEPVAARWFRAAAASTVQGRVVPHAGHSQGLATAAPGLGSPRDQLPERGPEPGHHASRPGRRAQRLARQPEPAAGGGEDDLGPESFYLVSGRLARMPSSA